MRFLAAEVTNFGSYKQLSFNFDNLGLTLIHGATGSGKSTLLDIIPWVLFGRTAKNGSVEDVRNWGVGGTAATTVGLQLLDAKGLPVFICRWRWVSQTDLYWTEVDGTVRRGKDITETQKLLNERLGIDETLYQAAAYYNEYSPTRNFFDIDAKRRRELLETLADLSLPALLTERISIVKKDTRKTHQKNVDSFNQAIGRLDQLRKTEATVIRDAERWSENQEKVIQNTILKAQNFDREQAAKIEAELEEYNYKESNLKAKLAHLTAHVGDAKCPTCGSPNKEEQARQREVALAENSLRNLRKPNTTLPQNPWLDQAEIERYKTNPFLSQKDTIKGDIADTAKKAENLKNQVDASNHKLHSLDQLRDIASTLRAELLKNAIKHVEHETNRYLEAYFDAEIRIQLELDDSDNLEVSVWKSGFACNYRQLSKGQKGLLKLCFSVSVMQSASNKAGIHFDTLSFDEALDGLDEDLKVKSFNLFSELEKTHGTILVIDHNSSFQTLFSSSFCVTLNNDTSEVERE